MPVESEEQALIARIRQRLPSDAPWVRLGIGDDAAVIEGVKNALEVLTTDTLVEGVHWDPRFCSPADVGHKSLAVNLSDLAAMGADPRAALLSLSLPPGWCTGSSVIDPFIDAFSATAREYGVTLVGGNVTSSPESAVITVTLTGSVLPRRVLTRGGGRAGDALYVTGSIGSALAGLLWLREHPSLDDPPEAGLAECVRRYRRPSPRVRVGSLVGRARAASAAMDLSDGLADAVSQVCRASRTGARIAGDLLPILDAAKSIFDKAGRDPVRSAVEGGDDYELLLVVPEKKKRAFETASRLSRGVPLTRIGELTKDCATVVVRDGREQELPAGFSHF